jgi:drug/metabolite transporter (DMT)-like permease
VNASGTAAGLGLLSAASWGGSDFIGGLGSRRAPALLVVASGHIVTLLILLGICLGAHLALPGRHDLLFSAAGGFEGAIALALFYRALSMGAMGLTAALAGLLTALVPVLFSLFHDGLPTLLTTIGLTVGLAAIWLITHSPAAKPIAAQTWVLHPFRALHEMGGRPQLPTGRAPKENAHSEAISTAQTWVPHPFRALGEMGGKPQPSTSPEKITPPAALLLGALAGLGFGTQLVLFKFASAGSLLWVMTAARAAGVSAMLLVLVAIPPKAPWRGFWLFGILAGAFDTLGNLLYIQTTRFGRLDVAAMICSLYPAGTILLAALVLREWPTRRQFAGIVLALAAVVLLSI